VGDRYVLELMKQKGWNLGGESSGHIICMDRTTTGDGIVSALQVMAYLSESGQTLHQAKSGMSKMPMQMINVPLSPDADPMSSEQVANAVLKAEEELNGKGRVLLRPSGTEPLIRVMVEGSNAALVQKLTKNIADTVASV
jgi:phosphoglucosamine mutase